MGIITAYWNGDTAISLKTINGGLSWNAITLAVTADVQYSIINQNIIYGVFVNRTKQYKTMDGGLNWTLVRHLPYTTVKDGGFHIFNSNGVGFAACDYGTRIVCLYSDTSDTAKSYGMYPPVSYSFIDSSVGFYLWGDYKLSKTLNRGVTDQIIYTFTDTVTHLFFLDQLNGWVCGKNGVIYKTTTGGTTSINSPNLKKKVKIYPNPTNEKIYLEYVNDVHIRSIQLMDMSGRVVNSFKNSAKNLDISHNSKGIYFLKIDAAEGSVSEKIVIE